ncbi:hypothetical protein KR200_007338 [Drosophila serrata]|nr:hypothetical protein KR200_007338 [Drosophila serrata]
MYKIRTLAEQGRKLPGTYKFVVMVCNDNRELVEDSPEDSARNENEKRLIDELAERDETISELKKKLLKCEELASQQALQLAESQNNEFENQALKAENSSVKHMQV